MAATMTTVLELTRLQPHMGGVTVVFYVFYEQHFGGQLKQNNANGEVRVYPPVTPEAWPTHVRR